MAKGRKGRSADYRGVYPYTLADGEVRYRCTWTASDGKTAEWAYGFTSPTAAHNHRATMIGEAQGGQRVVTRGAFAELFERWLRAKRSITEGTRAGYEDAYLKRLQPAFGAVPLSKLDFETINDAVDEWLDDERNWSAKTINNTIGTLSSFLSDMVRAGKLRQNPAQFIERVRDEDIERDWLRPDEIEDYLTACSDVYRPVADFLIGTGVRISEALAVKLPDLELVDAGVVKIMRTRRDLEVRERGARARRGRARREGATKGGDFRAVHIGPELAGRLQTRVAVIAEMTPDPREAYLFAMPARERKTDRGRWEGGGPMDRNTISRNWHKAALADAGLRDMPLHALRHTAAALWLMDHDIEFVRRQLGHAQITTTASIYGHFDRMFQAQRAEASERRRRAAVRGDAWTASS